MTALSRVGVLGLCYLAACATGPSPGRWAAVDIRTVGPRWEGCWKFSLPDASALSSPLSGDEVGFPIKDGLLLTLGATADVWPDFEGVRQPLVFAADAMSAPNLAVYWIPRPDGEGFVVKWRDESLPSRHVVLRVYETKTGLEGSASIPAAHFGLVLDPSPVTVERCDEERGGALPNKELYSPGLPEGLVG